MVVALTTAASEVRRIGASWLAETIPGSELVSSIRPVSTTDPIRDQLAESPGVQSVSPIGLFGVPLDGLRQEAAAIVGHDYLTDGRLVFVSGNRTSALTALDKGGSVVVPESLANQASPPISLGDTLRFATGPTETNLKVVGIVAHSIPSESEEAILIGWPDAESQFGVTGADFFAIRYAPGQEATARPTLDATALQYALEPNDLTRVQGTVGDALDRIFRLLDALALIAVLVAGLGMVNTLSMSVLERVREIGVLRATGMTARQVWAMVVVEAGMLGIVGSARRRRGRHDRRRGARGGLQRRLRARLRSTVADARSGLRLRRPGQHRGLDLPGRRGQPRIACPSPPARVGRIVGSASTGGGPLGGVCYTPATWSGGVPGR